MKNKEIIQFQYIFIIISRLKYLILYYIHKTDLYVFLLHIFTIINIIKFVVIILITVNIHKNQKIAVCE